MKAIILASFVFILTNAHASFTVTNCSNSDGSVVWETGPRNNSIDLKYANFVAGTLSLNMDQVKIDFKQELVLNEKQFRDCSYSSVRKVYAGKVKIVASELHPDVLRGQFPANKVITEVICTELSGRTHSCPR